MVPRSAEEMGRPKLGGCGLLVVGVVHSHADCQQKEAVGNGGDDKALKSDLGACVVTAFTLRSCMIHRSPFQPAGTRRHCASRKNPDIKEGGLAEGVIQCTTGRN